MADVLRFDDDYEIFFSPKEFLKNYFSVEHGTEANWITQTYLSLYHKFWTSLESNNMTMLEFGGGPTIYSLISACPHVNKIVFAEFTEPNRNELEAWLRKDASAFDWTPYFEHVVQTLEGKSKQETTARKEQLRRKITRVIPCDIRKQQPLMVEDADNMKFDVVASTGCLEAAVETDDQFCDAVAKMTKYVKPGGHLMLAGYLNSKSYYVGDEIFSDFSISESLVRRAFEEGGLEIRHFDASKRPSSLKNAAIMADYEGLFFTWGFLKDNK